MSIEQTSRELGDLRRSVARLLSSREGIVEQLAVPDVSLGQRKQLTLDYNNQTIDILQQQIKIRELEGQMAELQSV